MSPIDANWKMRLRMPTVVRAGHDHVRADDRAGADDHVGADDRIGADRRVGRDARGGIDQRGRMDVGHGVAVVSRCRRDRRERRQQLRLGRQFAVDGRLHRKAALAVDDRVHPRFEHQLIARRHLPLETRARNAGKRRAASPWSRASIVDSWISASITSTPGITG